MTQTLKKVMVVACLVTTLTACSATFLPEGAPVASVPVGGEVALAEERILGLIDLEPEVKYGLGVFAGQLVTSWMLILAAIYFIVVLFAPTFGRRSLSWGMWELLVPSPPGEDLGLLERVINSIDPVEATFNVLRMESTECRRRAVCELQQRASGVPLLGLLLQYISPSVRSMDEYREAQGAGAALEDCTLLYHCPASSLWGGQDQH